jgi:hypothetical protein
MDHITPSNCEGQTRRVAESLKRQLGPFCPLLAKPDLVELMLNADGTVWVDSECTRSARSQAASAEFFICMAHLVLTVSTALALALSCAPRVAPDVLLSVVHTESRWNTLAIHDNVTEKAFRPESKQEARQVASRWIVEDHNPDLGLLQINAANLSRTGLTIATAPHPPGRACRSPPAVPGRGSSRWTVPNGARSPSETRTPSSARMCWRTWRAIFRAGRKSRPRFCFLNGPRR